MLVADIFLEGGTIEKVAVAGAALIAIASITVALLGLTRWREGHH